MRISARVTARETAEGLTLIIDGDRDGLIIGRRGQTLDALQYITNRYMQRDQTRKTRVILDCEGYRRRRETDYYPNGPEYREKGETNRQARSGAADGFQRTAALSPGPQDGSGFVYREPRRGRQAKGGRLPRQKMTDYTFNVPRQAPTLCGGFFVWCHEPKRE